MDIHKIKRNSFLIDACTFCYNSIGSIFVWLEGDSKQIIPFELESYTSPSCVCFPFCHGISISISYPEKSKLGFEMDLYMYIFNSRTKSSVIK